MPPTYFLQALSPGKLSSPPLRPGRPSPAARPPLLLPASRAPRSHTSGLLSSLTGPCLARPPLLRVPLGYQDPHSFTLRLLASPFAPASRGPQLSFRPPGFALRPPRRSRPSRGEGWSLGLPGPPTPLGRRGRAPTSPRPSPLRRSPARPAWLGPARGPPSVPSPPRPRPTPPAAAAPEAKALLHGRPPLASIPCPDWPLLDNRPSQQNLRLRAPPSPTLPPISCRGSSASRQL